MTNHKAFPQSSFSPRGAPPQPHREGAGRPGRVGLGLKRGVVGEGTIWWHVKKWRSSLLLAMCPARPHGLQTADGRLYRIVLLAQHRKALTPHPMKVELKGLGWLGMRVSPTSRSLISSFYHRFRSSCFFFHPLLLLPALLRLFMIMVLTARASSI